MSELWSQDQLQYHLKSYPSSERLYNVMLDKDMARQKQLQRLLSHMKGIQIMVMLEDPIK